MLEKVNSIQLHHARLLYIVSELYHRNIISEEQKLGLKFGIFNDDSKLMDFYFETSNTQFVNHNSQLFEAPFEDLSMTKSQASCISNICDLQALRIFCDKLVVFMITYVNESTTDRSNECKSSV